MYINDLMKSAVGMVGISIADFYCSEPREIQLILEGYRIKQEQEFLFTQLAVSNAIGLSFKKGFKENNPFETAAVSSETPKKSSKEEKNETLSFLFNKFNKKVGDE